MATFLSGAQMYSVTPVPIYPGGYEVLVNKFGPQISRFGIISSAGLPPGALSVAADSLITIYGGNLASSTASGPYSWSFQLADVTVSIVAQPCRLNYAASRQVNALVPAGLSPGRHDLTLKNSAGQHSVSLMLELGVPTLFNSSGNAAALHGNYQLITASNPAAIGEIVSLFATGLGAVTARNGLQVANAIPTVWVDGQMAVASFAGRAPGFQGLDQINLQIPAGVRRGMAVS